VKRILFVARDYPPEGIGGIATYVYFMANKLKALSGFKITVLADTKGKERVEELTELKIVRLRALNNLQWYSKSTFWLIKNYKFFDFIEGELFGANLFFAKVILGKKLRYHINGHGSHWKTFVFERKQTLFRRIKTFIMDQMEKYVFTHSLYNLCPSASYAEMLAIQWNYPLEKIYVVNNLIQEIRPGGRNQFNLSGLKAQKYFLYYGKFQYLKGGYYLMRLIPSLLNFFPDYYFVFVGKDMDNFKEKFEHYFWEEKKQSFLNKVIFLDNVGDRQKLYKIVAGAEVVFIPSLYESYAYTLLESIILNKKICCTLAGGLKDILLITKYQNYFSLAIDDEDYQATADQIKDWLNSFQFYPVAFDVKQYNRSIIKRYLNLLEFYER
jgi:glycosyltransferase involved in cell wall biosynthesis